MHTLSVSAEGDYYRCVPPDPSIAAAALGACESGTLLGTVHAQALHTFTLDSHSSLCTCPDQTCSPPWGPDRCPFLHCPPVSGGSVRLTVMPSPPFVLYELGSSLYTLATEPPQALLWHHRLGHPSVPRLRGMHSRLLVSGLPRSLPPLPPSPAPPCLPCVEGRQRAAPHSSSFPPTTAPLQTLHMDVWGPARVSGQGRERYFLLVDDDYTRYTTDLPVLHLHSDRGGEFSSNLLRDFCRGEGILQSFTLLDSPQQNGIAERRIGLVMEVARTSMIHAAAPHFLWPFAVRYAAHQLNLWPRVSLPETSPTMHWTGEVGDASVFRFYHPASRHVLPSQDVTFDESVPFYGLFPYRSPPPPPPPVFLAPGAAPGAASGGATFGGAGSEGAGSGGAEPEGVEPGGVESEGAECGGAEPQGAASSGDPAGASPRLSPQQLREWLVRRARLRSGVPGAGGAGDAGAGGAGVIVGACGTGGTAAAGPGGARARGAGAAGTSGVGGAGAGDPMEPGAGGAGGSCAGGAGAGGAGAGGAGVEGTGAGGAGAAGAGAVDPRAGCAGGNVQPRPYFVPLLQQVLGPASRPVSPVRTARRVPHSRPPPVPGTHAMALRPSSVPLRVPLRAPPESSLLESAAASALIAELLDFAAAYRQDYATALVAESESTSLPSIGVVCALGMDVLEDRQEDFECLAAAVPRFTSMPLAPEGDLDAPDIPTPRSYAEAITGPYSFEWQAAMDAEMASWKSTGTYVDEVPPPGVNIVDGMWIFRVKRPPGSPRSIGDPQWTSDKQE
ncbi:unnamed protein product [Closterium sp. NIES-53]